jgi:hypothetical protein
MSPALPAGAQLTWATGWLLERSPENGECRLRIWRAEPGAGTPLLWANDGSVMWAYFGGQDPRLQDAAALSDAWVESFLVDPAMADRLSGVFALIAVDLKSGRIVAACDRLGVQGIYYTPSHGAIAQVGTHLTWLLLAAQHDGEVDDQACVTHFAFGYTVDGTQTVYRNIHRVPAASCLIAGDGPVEVRGYWRHAGHVEAPRVTELAGMLRRTLAPWPGSSLFLPVTAGKDSLCLAALLPANVDVHTGTFGLDGCADRLQGRALADALRAPYAGVDVCDADALDRWIDHIALHSAGLATASYVDMASFVDGAVPHHTPMVFGEGGECVRDFFATPDGATAALSRDYMTAAALLEPSLHRRFAPLLAGYPAAMLDRAKDVAREPDDTSFALHFYRSVRMPGNFSLRHAVLAPLRPKLSPFLDRDFVAATYGLPQEWFAGSRLHRMLLESTRPEWLGFFDRPQSTRVSTQGWEERIAGDTGRALASSLRRDLAWCEDVFDVDGVEALMRSAATQPGKAVYHLLRIASFAAARRVLRSEAALEHAAWIGDRTAVITPTWSASSSAGEARPRHGVNLLSH